jgi:hypothetical protein
MKWNGQHCRFISTVALAMIKAASLTPKAESRQQFYFRRKAILTNWPLQDFARSERSFQFGGRLVTAGQPCA